MNKKIIALIIAILVIIAGVGVYFILNNNTETSTQPNDVDNNQSNNQTNNNDNQSSNNQDEDVTDETNILVLYFSMSGNTEAVANIIHDEVGGDIIKLETVQTYPEEYNDLVDYAQEEQRENARPELATEIDNIEDYDIIFLGFPNWWGDMPMPIYTFLDSYDLSGKTIAPFITHGGSGLSGTPANIQEEEPKANVTTGLAISGSRAESSQDDVIDWLNELGL